MKPSSSLASLSSSSMVVATATAATGGGGVGVGGGVDGGSTSMSLNKALSKHQSTMMTQNGLVPPSSSSSSSVQQPLSSSSYLKKQQTGAKIPSSSLNNTNQQQLNHQQQTTLSEHSQQQPSWRDEINREKRKELYSLASKIACITSEDNKIFLDRIVDSWKKSSSKEEFSNFIAKLIFTNYKPASYTLENIQKDIFDCINTKSNTGTSNIASNVSNLQNNMNNTTSSNTNTTTGTNNNNNNTTTTEDFTALYWKIYEQLRKHSTFIKTEVLVPLQKRCSETQSKLEKFPKGSSEYEKLSLEYTKQFDNAKHLDLLIGLFNSNLVRRNSFKPNEGHMKFISSLKEGLKKKYKMEFDQDFDLLTCPEKDLEIGIETLNESLGFSYLVSTNSFVGDFNCFNLIPSNKKRYDNIPNLSPNPKKRLSTIEIIKRILVNEVKMDELPTLTYNIVDPPLIKVEKQSESVYTVIFIVHPKEKGTITLPNLNIDVFVEDLNILPCSITFKNNYATEMNSLFVNMRKYFNNLIGGRALLGISKGTDNVPFHNLHSSITLPQILNSWIQSIIYIIKDELM